MVFTPPTTMPRVTRLLGILAALIMGGPVLAQHTGHEHGAGPPARAAGGAAATARPALASGAAVGPDGRLWVVGLDKRRRLFLRHSADEGKTWSPEVFPDIGRDQPAADGESRPKIAFGPKSLVVLAYTHPLAKPYTGEIRLLRSTDGGQSFSAPVTVHQDRQVITHRFESIVFDGRGRLHVLWVDKRDQQVSRRPGASIYRALSDDGGAQFGPDTRVAESSCECCRIALLPEGEDRVVAMWRHVFDGQVRDHAFARITPQDPVPPKLQRASRDGWKIEACPHHGPGLARAADGGFHAVWFGERQGEPAVRYGRLSAEGLAQGPVTVLPDERAEHADVISHERRVAIVWRGFDGRQTRLRAWVSSDDGANFKLLELAQAQGATDHPRLVRRGDRFLVVWRTEQEIKVEPIAF